MIPFRALLIAAALLAVPVVAAAGGDGVVSQLSGTLTVRKADGTVRILARESEIEQGDTIVTERDSYAQVRFRDGGRVTLKPQTSVRLDQFRFAQDKPKEDAFALRLLRGGLRSVTGGIGKRNPENFQMTTETATVGVRGTTFSVDDCVTERGGDCARLEPAVYVGVSDGEVVVRNGAGELALGAGQFGHIARGERPLFQSTDPGLRFAPPATFLQSILSGRQVAGIGEKLECAISVR
ncbi:MAG TPA: FecR domain-containing protein [Burkholderiales bacterium]|nr:FecR domain-containing protein [Burkholderiales bacterium]